jgi:hypothetical protein
VAPAGDDIMATQFTLAFVQSLIFQRSLVTMSETQYTLVVLFSGNARYPLKLDNTNRHWGLLAAEILRYLKDSFVDPLPNPKHLLLRSSSGELITADGLWARSLGGYYPTGTEHILSVDQGKTFPLPFDTPTGANFGKKTVPQLSSQHWSKRNGSLPAFCCCFPSLASMDFSLVRREATPSNGKRFFKET